MRRLERALSYPSTAAATAATRCRFLVPPPSLPPHLALAGAEGSRPGRPGDGQDVHHQTLRAQLFLEPPPHHRRRGLRPQAAHRRDHYGAPAALGHRRAGPLRRHRARVLQGRVRGLSGVRPIATQDLRDRDQVEEGDRRQGAAAQRPPPAGGAPGQQVRHRGRDHRRGGAQRLLRGARLRGLVRDFGQGQSVGRSVGRSLTPDKRAVHLPPSPSIFISHCRPY